MTISELISFCRACLSKWFPLNNNCILAEPWRRLLAAFIDTTIILAAHVATFLFIVSSGTLTLSEERAITCLSPVFCWSYVAIGWRLSQTPGMWMTGILVVTDRFQQMNSRTVLLRIFGFIVACLPVKIGLLPIFYDSRRQGWHDRIAHTVVIKSSKGLKMYLPLREVTEPKLSPSVPNFMLPWRWFLPALAIYSLLTVGMTWPTAAHMNTRIMGVANDPYLFIWNYWYFHYAITHHLSLTSTNLIFYPRTVSLGQHTMQWFNCILAEPLMGHLNPIAIYNLLNLVSVTLTAVSGYWTITALVKSSKIGLVGGAAFGFSPFFMGHLLGHANLVAAEFLPPAILCSYTLMVTGRAKYAFWFGVWTALAGLCDLQYFLFSFLITGVLAVALWLNTKRPTGQECLIIVSKLAFGSLIGCILLFPVLLPAFSSMIGTGLDSSRESGMFRADLLDWIHPGVLSYWGGRQTGMLKGSEENVNPGYVFLLLAAVGYFTNKRDSRTWAFVALVFVVLASGPYLTINGDGVNLAESLLTGFPGAMFDLPWNTNQLVFVALSFTSEPASAVGFKLLPTLPYNWLPAIVPLLKPFRVPLRFGLAVVYSCIVMGSFALRTVITELALKKGPFVANGFLAAVAVIALSQCWCAPFVSFIPVTYPFYRLLGHDQSDFEIAELPIVGNELSAYGQTFHHKPLFKSFISRHPKDIMPFVNHIELLENEALMTKEGYTKAESDAATRELQNLKVRYIIVNPKLAKVALARELLPQWTIVYQSPSMDAYRLNTTK